MEIMRVEYIGDGDKRTRGSLGEALKIGYLLEGFIYIFDVTNGWFGWGEMDVDNWMILGPCEEPDLIDFIG